jgi:N-acetylglucosamine kinase-like BadF-type ATPase
MAVTGGAATYVLGIDAGGTKTVCLLADGEGRVLSEARGGGANLQAAGELEVEKTLHRVMDDALGDRDVVPQAICLGMAGVDRGDDAAVVRAIMRRIGHKARVLVTNDALVALVAGAGHEPGIVVIAGTGSIAYGRNAAGRAARAGGWGYVLGDEGSGYWIGRLALRAVVRQADGRGRPTALTPLILEHFKVAKPQDLVHEVYHRNLKPSAIAQIARQVQQAMAEGDAVAASILENGARELIASADSVATQLGMHQAPFTFFLAGGIFHAVPWLASTLTERLPRLAPHATVRMIDREPAYGAVLIALAATRGEDVIPAYQTS